MSDREALIKRLNEDLTELHNLLRERHESLDVFLRRTIIQHASEEMLGKVVADVVEEIHKRKR